ISKQIPVAEKTRFRLGSITKSFLALGFLKLAEEGSIDINTPIGSLAPEISFENKWEGTDPVRLIHLLEHTAGFDDIHLNDLSLIDISNVPLIASIARQKKSLKVRWVPGSRYAYSSVGYTVAGYILEKLTDQKYEDFLREEILDPIGMNTSGFYLAGKTGDLFARGYEDGMELPEVFMFSRPAGSMTSTLTDFSLFLRLMLNNGTLNDTLIFDDVTIGKMEQPQSSTAARNGLKIGYGSGLQSYYKDGILWFGHSGGGPGCLARFAYCRGLDIAYIFMMNSFKPEVEQTLKDIITGFIAQNQQPTITHTVSLNNNILNSYTGYYAPKNPRFALFGWLSVIFDGINIDNNNDTLRMVSFLGEETTLLPVSETLFREQKEPDAGAVFITSNENEIIFQKGNKYYLKTAGWKPWLYRALFVIAIIGMISVVFVAMFLIPYYLVRKYILRKIVSINMKMIVFPFLAIVSLIIGMLVVSNQTQIEMTQMTTENILFCVSTWLFAAFSIAGILVVIINYKKSSGKSMNIYATIVSLSFIGFTIFLAYWGFIGLKLWAF
nr:serine hydrolase [Bacteroidota bacterium]